MQRALLVLLLAGAAAGLDLGPELYLFGASWHGERNNPNRSDRHYNSLNPGIGYGIVIRSSDHVRGLVAGGTYFDSMGQQATFGQAGVRIQAGQDQGWQAGLDLTAGTYQGSGWDGVGAVVSSFVGYKSHHLHVTVAPKLDNVSDTWAIGVFYRLTLDR